MLEHPPQHNITQSELAPLVSSYFDNLLAQRDAILASYNLTPETAEQFCDIHTSDEDREKMLALYEYMVYVIENKKIPPSIDRRDAYRMAQEIMGNEFFGTEQIEKALGIHLNKDDIPDIPFSLDELEKAKELKQFLILRVDKTDDKTPLTMKHIEHMLHADFEKANKGEIFYHQQDYRDEDFFTQEVPRYAWALVSKGLIPNTTYACYQRQTERLVEFLTDKVFRGREMPESYKIAIEEFEQQKDEMEKLYNGRAAELNPLKLEELELTKLTRSTPVEVFYDIMVYFQNTGLRLLNIDWAWTSRRVGNEFIRVGSFDSEGVRVHSFVASFIHGFLGVVFSREM